MQTKVWRWVLGLIYKVAVATIWIAASFVVQSVVDCGVSPFLITYICNSLFVIYIPLVEIVRCLEDSCGSLFFWRNKKCSPLQELGDSEQVILLGEIEVQELMGGSSPHGDGVGSPVEFTSYSIERVLPLEEANKGVDAKGRWTCTRVTKFTWVKLVSVLLCMAGTIIVSLGDSKTGLSPVASNALPGDFLALVSAGLYAVFLVLFNLFVFLPIALVLNFTMLEPCDMEAVWSNYCLLDNVLSDYLWAKALILTTTTVATANLTVQVPLAAIVDSVIGNATRLMDYLGAVAV
ncbi:hypothetical protein P3X46_011867 [Hevea brasiliensis]|uniref:Amino acid transporter transmembrane domain-containing protein n=1 Tax=Hevea brasiliensis TaxID=3981 RepID=A0ABQ9MAJ8_HEVBR|nr:hypothetical protein P3X46_011867 [Hevea brasiliensis]